MKQYLKTKGLKLGLICALVVMIILFSLLLSSGRVSFVENGVQVITRPLETGIRNLVSGFEQLYDRMHNYDVLEERYLALRNQLAEYEHIARDARGIHEENERLRALLNMPPGGEAFRYIDALVLSWDASNWASAFTIDRGENFGIAVGDPVMTERREFIGIVREVGSSWARVETLLDPSVGIGAQMGTGAPAVAQGNFALMLEGALRLSYVPSGETPLLNDVVTTSGLGGVIPAGLVIGRISNVGIEGTGANFYAIIEPAVQLGNLSQVFIVQRMETDLDDIPLVIGE